jgi:hypothetical protein
MSGIAGIAKSAIKSATSAATSVANKARKRSTPTNLATQYGQSVAAKTNYQTPFSQVLPWERFARPDVLTNIAYGRIDPEIKRQGYAASRNLEANLGTTGGARFGSANVQRQGLLDQFERQRQEQANAIYNQLASARQQEYQDLMNQYYTSPNSFVMPTLQAAPTGQPIAKSFEEAASKSGVKDYRFASTPNIYQG